MAKNFYDILGVSKDASEEEIKKSYRRLAKTWHPDVNKGDKAAEEKFKEVSEAYETLSNKEKRKQYDMFGAYGPQGGAGFDPSQWAGGGSGGQGFQYEDLSDLLRKGGFGRGASTQAGNEDIGDIFGDIFGMPRSRAAGGRARSRPREDFSAETRGRDIYYSMEIEFMEAVRGTTSKISIHRGNKIEKMDVKIPAGVNTGSKIRLAGKGEASPGRGKPGDLYIEIKVKPHKIFWREGDDLFLEAPLSVGEATSGSVIRLPTLDGHAELKIPPGTPSDQKFRLKGKGVPHLETKVPGDLYVITQIIVPKTLDERSRHLMEEFEKLNPMNLRKDF